VGAEREYSIKLPVFTSVQNGFDSYFTICLLISVW